MQKQQIFSKKNLLIYFKNKIKNLLANLVLTNQENNNKNNDNPVQLKKQQK